MDEANLQHIPALSQEERQNLKITNNPRSIQWSCGIPLLFCGREPKEMLQTAVELFKKAKEVPKWLSDEASCPDLSDEHRKLYRHFSFPLYGMVLVDDYPEEDSKILKHGLIFLLEMCLSLREYGPERWSTPEGQIRAHVDVLFNQIARVPKRILSLGLERQFQYQAGRTIWVPYSSRTRLIRAKTDTVLCVNSPYIFQGSIRAQELREEAMLFDDPTYPTWHVSILLWLSEYHTDVLAGERQLSLVLSAAQFQRRALGFTTHAIYGCLVVENYVRIFVSYWKGVDNPSWGEGKYTFIDCLGLYDLTEPWNCVQFHNFFRGVVQYNAGLMDEINGMSLDKMDEVQRGYGSSWQARIRYGVGGWAESEMSDDGDENLEVEDEGEDEGESEGEEDEGEDEDEDEDVVAWPNVDDWRKSILTD